jgi:hypothetical protein
VAALVKSVNSRLSNKQIKNVILNNIEVRSQISGIVNTSGRLYAYKAVLAAQRMAGMDKIGVFRNEAWYLDYLGEGHWSSDTKAHGFGESGFNNVIGRWQG